MAVPSRVRSKGSAVEEKSPVFLMLVWCVHNAIIIRIELLDREVNFMYVIRNVH